MTLVKCVIYSCQQFTEHESEYQLIVQTLVIAVAHSYYIVGIIKLMLWNWECVPESL